MGTSKFLEARKRMVTGDLIRRGITDPGVLDAFMKVPRERFMTPGLPPEIVYGDHPYPLGFGQTISQPYIVALMVQALGCHPGATVLEIGTGSGYQTAILASMGFDVITLEVVHELAVKARRTILELFPDADVRFIEADGHGGWEPAAPYSGIIVSAAPDSVPRDLEEQLSGENGRMVIPLGGTWQELVLIERRGFEFIVNSLMPVRFVPLVKPGR